MQPAGQLTIILVFAVLVEMLVEYFVKPLIPKTEDPEPKWYYTLPYSRYAAGIVGIALCLVYRLDIIALLFGVVAHSQTWSYVGMVLTGLLISRGANYVHDWIVNVRAYLTN
jgi:hypothetical protein